MSEIPKAIWIHPVADIRRYHAAARMIEDDLEGAYLTCREKYGADVAGVLIVAILRQKLNDKKDQWPPPEDLIQKVNNFLVEHGLMIDNFVDRA